MLNICILDDQIEEAQKTKELLITYLAARNREYNRIDIFQHGNDILNNEKEYDILFLDIEVGSENGIEIAKKLRAKQPNLIIIVVTSFIKYSIEGYKINAARYLLKPLSPSLLYSELDEILQYNLQKESILIYNRQEEVRIFISDIYYFESYGRKVQFHTKDKCYISKETLSNWAKKLSNHFVECYKGIYVHVKYIEMINKELLQLDNKQTLPIARRRYDALKKAWIAYQEMIV